MAFLLRLPVGGVQKNYKFNRLRYGNLKQAKGPLKVLAVQRQKLIKEDQKKGRYDKKLNKIKLLNSNLKNCTDVIELFQLTQKNQKIMDAINVSTSATIAARLISSNNIDDIELKNIQAIYTLLGQLILQHVHKMNERSVANCLWSIGKAVDRFGIQQKQEYYHVFGKLCQRAKIISSSMTTQAASNSLWAIAKFQWDDNRLVQKLIQQAIKSSKKEFLPQNICNILWSMATLQCFDINAIQHFAELSKTCLQEMNVQGVANLMWALQQLRYYDQELTLIIEDIIINNKNIVFDSQNISNIVLAFTDFGLQNKQKILKILKQQFVSNKFFTLQSWSNFLYALALLDCPVNLSQQVVEELLGFLNKNNQQQNFQSIHLVQFQQAQILYNIRGQKLDFPENFNQNCKQELQVYTREQTLQKQSFLDVVFPIFESHFNIARKSFLIYDDQVRIDIALYKDEKNKVAIFTFPTQSYFANCPEKLLGRCQQQKFLLEQFGWQVVEVSAFFWNTEQYQKQVINYIKAKFI